MTTIKLESSMASNSFVRRPLVFNAVPTIVARDVLSVGGGYSVKNKGTEAEIYLYGDVGDSWFGGVTAKQFADDLKAAGKVDTIQLHINSPGGDVFDGLTIYRLLVDHKAKVIVHIDGLAASIASVIAMAGNEINISESGFLMIHNAWGIAMGAADDMRTMADLLDKTTGSIRDVYVARTGKSGEAVKSWMDAETWFSAQEAKDNGFVTAISDNMRLAARIDPAKHKGLKHLPSALTGTPNLDDAKARIQRMKNAMERRRTA
jgi:ATP-dependent Clp protease protease subunit